MNGLLCFSSRHNTPRHSNPIPHELTSPSAVTNSHIHSVSREKTEYIVTCTKTHTNVKHVTVKRGRLASSSESRHCATILHLAQMQNFNFVDINKMSIQYLIFLVPSHGFLATIQSRTFCLLVCCLKT
jgi:hypothetical protein